MDMLMVFLCSLYEQQLTSDVDHRSLQILDELSKNDSFTQRDLRSRLGIALGLVNIYIKNLVKKGYITVKAISPNRLLSPMLVQQCDNCSIDEFYSNGINPNYTVTFEMFLNKGYEIWMADRHGRLIQPSDVQRRVKAGRCDSGVINYIFIPLANQNIACKSVSEVYQKAVR